ncbi:MAG: DUF2085 domain-containing protein [Chloroflexota bacterium]|nr:DUF2085 domain-containing protein [Chloroflexota bacterium]
MSIISKISQSSFVRKIPWQKISYLIAISLLIAWLRETPAGLLGKADAIGYAVCHRIDLRSFHLGERQMPLCVRCTGQYLGAMLGLGYQLMLGRRRCGRPPWGVIAVLATFVLAYAVDGLNSYLHLLPGMSRFYIYEPNNTLRLLTGTGLGLGLSVVLLPAFHQTVWKRWDRRPALDGFKALGGAVALGFLLDLLILTENPLILYPIAIITTGGVLVLLSMVYAMVWVMLFRMENKFERFSELIFPLVAGFTVALLQIAALDYLRYLFTGTWAGFHFG